ncbi:unnamed protein product, partial [Brassica rapa]
TLPVPVIEAPFARPLSDAGGVMARRRRPSKTLRLSLLLSSIRSSSLVSSVSLSWSENIVTVSFSGGSRSMFSVSSSAHRLTLTVMCLVGLRSVRISSRFIVIAPVRALIVSHAVDGSPLRPSLKVSRDDVVKPFGSLSTGVVIFWGSPLFLSLLSATTTVTHQCSATATRFNSRKSLNLRGNRRSAPTLTPSSVPLNRRCSLSGDPSSCQRQRNSIAQACEMGLFACRLGLVSLLNFIQSHSIVSKPICLWGRLVYLASLLKNSDGFIGLFTETNMLTMSYLSFLKRTLIVFLPVGSLGSLSSSSPYSSPSSSSPAFSRRSVSPSAHVRRCISKSITVLLSCGAVRSGPEDAADLVSTIFRGADWISTSLFNVTKFQPSGTAVNLTHSSFAMNSLSLYLR